MSFRLAAYAVCIEDGRVLLALSVPPKGESTWTLPGGRVEHGEDPFDTVIREVAAAAARAGVERLAGLTDAEHLWEPAADSLSIRPGGDGVFRVDELSAVGPTRPA